MNTIKEFVDLECDCQFIQFSFAKEANHKRGNPKSVRCQNVR